MDIAIALLQYYGFDLGGHTADYLVHLWRGYDPSWVRLAIVESLYQGRYKAVSVTQILSFWQRKGEPYCRFNHEFERLVCGDFVFTLPNVPQKVVYETAKSSSATRSPFPKVRQSATYKAAVESMGLLSESSLFVDKLKSMCRESNVGSIAAKNLEPTISQSAAPDLPVTTIEPLESLEKWDALVSRKLE